jgi:type I restriction enzyme M protein
MAKEQVKEAKSKDAKTTTDVLESFLARYSNAGFEYKEELDSSESKDPAAIVWGNYLGTVTPRILLLALSSGNWDKANPDYLEVHALERMPTDAKPENYAQFAVVADTDGHEAVFDLAYPAHEIDRLPAINEINDYKRLKTDPKYRWSMKIYDRFMKGFNAFHEQVYQTVKDRVSDKNDIIEEVAKILFLESFRLHHEGASLQFSFNQQTLRLDEVFNVEYIHTHGEQAIEQIKKAFDHFKSHEDYMVKDDAGKEHPIFDEQTHLRLTEPRNYETLLDLIQNLGSVTDNQGKMLKDKGTLADISADVLGRAFDVFLRANFDSKGGLGVYLTPAPVKHAMLAMAFHDIKEQGAGILTARNADDTPAFRICDPACGSAGFLSVALGYLQQTLQEILNLETSDDARRNKLFKDMCEHSFVGADSAPRMVMLARVNMALLGARRAHIFYTQNSLSNDQLKPGSFDLICTNPPFGTPKFGKTQEESKKNYERNMEQILERFRSDLKEREGKGGGYTYEPSVTGLAMGGKPDSKGIWKPVSPTSIDPAVLFIDRCLQLLKPGGRLLIILPDGVLCNSGDRYVREYIMGKKDEATGQFHGGKAIVKGVISLPSDTFKLSGTGAKTSILYLQKREARADNAEKLQDAPQSDVFMAVADTLGYVVKNNVEDYSAGVPNDLAAITGAYVRGE